MAVETSLLRIWQTHPQLDNDKSHVHGEKFKSKACLGVKFPKMSQQTSCREGSWRQVVFHLLPLRLWCWCEKQPTVRPMSFWGPGSAPLGFGGDGTPPGFQQISREHMARISGNRRPRSRCSHSRSRSPPERRCCRSHSPDCSPAGSRSCPSSSLGRRRWRSRNSWCLGAAAGEQGMRFSAWCSLCSLLLYIPWLGDAVKSTRHRCHSWHQFAN